MPNTANNICQVSEVMHMLDDRKQACSEAESRCQQLEEWLMSERQTIQGLLSLKADFEARITQVQLFEPQLHLRSIAV